jgi:hypothetical protein
MDTNETRKTVDVTTKLEPEAVVEQLRTLRQQIADVEPLTKAQRKQIRNQIRIPDAAMHASVSALGASEKIAQALDTPATDVRDLIDETNRWVAVEDELKSMLRAISDANIVRRQRTAVLTGQAYLIGVQLVRDPKNAELRPHIDEIARLRKQGNPKRTAKTPPATTPAPSTSPTPKTEI